MREDFTNAKEMWSYCTRSRMRTKIRNNQSFAAVPEAKCTAAGGTLHKDKNRQVILSSFFANKNLFCTYKLQTSCLRSIFVFTAMKGDIISFYVSTTPICQKGGAEETAHVYYLNFEGQGDVDRPDLDPAQSSLGSITVPSSTVRPSSMFGMTVGYGTRSVTLGVCVPNYTVKDVGLIYRLCVPNPQVIASQDEVCSAAVSQTTPPPATQESWEAELNAVMVRCFSVNLTLQSK